jgi:hypothetical protein
VVWQAPKLEEGEESGGYLYVSVVQNGASNDQFMDIIEHFRLTLDRSGLVWRIVWPKCWSVPYWTGGGVSFK